MLTILTIGYIAGELGHYLIGITSKQTAIDIHYGDFACQQNTSDFRTSQLTEQCVDIAEPNRYMNLCLFIYVAIRLCSFVWPTVRSRRMIEAMQRAKMKIQSCN